MSARQSTNSLIPRCTRAALCLGFAATAALAGCDAGPWSAPPRKSVRVQQVSPGDVALDSVSQALESHWLTDANVVALLGLVNQRQIDLAHAELQGWASDTIQALAVGMLRAYGAQQQSLDSLAAALKLTGAMPAVGVSLDTTLQQRAAALNGYGGPRLDSAFVSAAQAQNAWAAAYFDQLSTVATAPELAAFAANAANRATLQQHAIAQFLAARAAPPSDSSRTADSTRRR